MKILSIVPLVLFCSSVLAQSPESVSTAGRAQIGSAWSVVGQWRCTQPAWTDTVTLSADGTFFRTVGEPNPAGRWSLGGLHDGVILTLAWRNWPVQTVALIGPDEFRGKVLTDGRLDDVTMRRVQPPAAIRTGAPSVEVRSWHQGEPPVRLIRKEEGVCALSRVTGHFEGAGEEVKVYVGEDGYWYLGGDSHQNDVAADCVVVRWQ